MTVKVRAERWCEFLMGGGRIRQVECGDPALARCEECGLAFCEDHALICGECLSTCCPVCEHACVRTPEFAQAA
jgi:hypothetical protein